MYQGMRMAGVAEGNVGSGSKAVRVQTEQMFPVCTSKQTQGVHKRRTASIQQWSA
jgi:hypothetical protein